MEKLLSCVDQLLKEKDLFLGILGAPIQACCALSGCGKGGEGRCFVAGRISAKIAWRSPWLFIAAPCHARQAAKKSDGDGKVKEPS